MNPSQKEVLFSKEMLSVVQQKVDGLKSSTKAWQATDYLPDFSHEDWRGEVIKLQERANTLSGPLFMSLAGNMVTEEGLPSYSTWINQTDHVGDVSGVDSHPWAQWARGWTAEENKHGDLLHKYLYLSGRVDMRAIEESINDFLRNGFDTETKNCPYRGFAFTSFQERATRISHTRTGLLAKKAGNEQLQKICNIIAMDEGRHEVVYQAFIEKCFQLDPNAMMIAFMETMKSGIIMPFKATGKDSYNFFSEVTEAVGMYTYNDYISILEFLINKWKVESIKNLSSEATAAQEYICNLPARYKKIEARKKVKTVEDITRPLLWVKPFKKTKII